MIEPRTDSTGREWTCRHGAAQMWFWPVTGQAGECVMELQVFQVPGTASVWAARALVTDDSTDTSVVVYSGFSFYSWGQAADAISEWWNTVGIQTTRDVLITAVDGLNGLYRNLGEP